MKIRRTDPLGGQPLDSQDLQESAGDLRFAETLSRLGTETPGDSGKVGEGAEFAGAAADSGSGSVRSELERIARTTDLADGEGLKTALENSARVLVRSRLGPRLQQNTGIGPLIEQLSQQITADPALRSQLTHILQQLVSR
ncbi:MAG: hypothetical protein ACKV2V_07190 [Blastocatellia bacterium]